MADLIENCRGHREMIGLLTVLGALLLGARAQQQEIRLVGSDVTLVPKYTGDLQEIEWMLNDKIFVEIVLKPKEKFTHNLTNDRAAINKANGALTIKNLTIGDSGLYKAEVTLMDNSIKVTEIRLTVHDCPDQPIISVQSTKDWFVVSCKSFSPNVTYEWFNPTTSVSKSRSYTEPKNNGTLTCVVDNKECNKSSSITFYTPDQPEVKSVGDEVILIPEYTGDPSEIIWKVNGDDLVKMELKPRVHSIYHRLQDRVICEMDGRLVILELTIGDSGVYTALILVNNEYYYTEIRLTAHGRESRGAPEVKTNGIAIGSLSLSITLLIFIFIFIFLLWYYCYKRTDQRKNEQGQEEVPFIEDEDFDDDDDDDKNVENGNAADGNMEGVKADKDDDVKKGIALVSMGENVDKIGRKKPSTQLEMAIFKPQDSDIERAEESERCITVMFWNYVISPIDESEGLLEGPLKRIQSLPLTIYGVQTVDDEIFTAEAVMSDGKEGTFTEGTDMKKMVWKKDGVTLFEWAVSSLKFHASNLKLEPGSVTVYDAEGKESYIVFFRLEEPPESMSICSITFHPIKMTGIDPSTWKKDSQLLNIEGDRIKRKPNGDLTIYDAISEDKGKYTVQNKDNELDQEFILHL